MQADLFKCSYCSERFDLDLQIPKLLISCPHCLCLKCLKLTFSLYSPERRQCPVCNMTLLTLIKAPEDFPNNITIVQLLQNQSKRKLRNHKELLDHKPALNNRKQGNLFQDKVRKKQKTAQEMDDQLVKMQEIITNQFAAMRKMLHTEALPESKLEFVKKEENSENPFTEITNKLEGIFTETEETFHRILKTKRSQVLAKQIPQEKASFNILPSAREDFKVKIEEGLSPLKASPMEVEEEFSSEDNERNQLILDEIQEMKKQIMLIDAESSLVLDFSDKEISETIFTHLISEDFWNEIDKNKVFYLEALEVNFSGSSLTDQQFIKFVQNLVSQMKNLTSITLNFAKTKISSPSLQALSDQCMKKHKLKTFVLNCSQTSIGDEGFESLDDGLNFSTETLKSLELILDLTDIEGEELLESLFRMERLKSLKLSFDQSRISSEVVVSVVACLSFVGKNLESLELNFNGTEIGDESLEKFSLSQMAKLKHFKFSLGGTIISNEFLVRLFENLSPLANHLETFELDLHSTELSNRTFKRFCIGTFSEMKNLETLKLDLSATRLMDISLNSLILPSQKLKSLSLNFSENDVHDFGLQSFKENNSFNNIERINFQAKHTGVSDEALQEFLNHVETKDLSPSREAPSMDPSNKITKGKREIGFKTKVFLELKKQLAIHNGSKADSARFDSSYVSSLIGRLEPKLYNNMMMKVLRKTLPIEKITTMEVEKWKRIIGKMIFRRKKIHQYIMKDSEFVLSFEWLQKYGKEILFREKVREILKSMKTRTFSILYQKILDFIQELSKTYKSWKIPDTLQVPTVSINWWQRYIRRDEGIKKLWKKLVIN